VVPLLRLIRKEFRLDWQGIHGAPHWARVRQNGLLLCKRTGADPLVVELFAWLHDSRRRSDGRDPHHGNRAAEFAAQLRGIYFQLDDRQFRLLCEALEGHSHGGLEGDVTVQVCWDSDRLDLGRVGIKPRAERLCTDAARDPAVLHWAYRNSVRHYDRMLFGK
jgi:uncharacterized protein